MKKQSFSFIEYIGEKIYLILFLAGIGTGLILCVIMLNNIVNNSISNTGTIDESKITSFDQTTINKLNNLYKSNENNSIVEQSTRISPFSE